MKHAPLILSMFLFCAGCASTQREPDLPGMVIISGVAQVPADYQPDSRTILQVRVINATLAGAAPASPAPSKRSYVSGLEVLAESVSYPGKTTPFAFTLEVPSVLIEKGQKYEVVAELYESSRRTYSGARPISPSGDKDISNLKIELKSLR